MRKIAPSLGLRGVSVLFAAIGWALVSTSRVVEFLPAPTAFLMRIGTLRTRLSSPGRRSGSPLFASRESSRADPTEGLAVLLSFGK